MSKEKPILFSGAMVRAILEGKKTQTRRVIKPQPMLDTHTRVTACYKCPYGAPGDRLWVRETWTTHQNDKGADCLLYRAEVPDPELYAPWRPSIFMPRAASRIMLEVTGVRVERIQEISEADAIAEGVEIIPIDTSTWTNRQSFSILWDKINAKRGYSWASNPWVFVISFKLINP